MFRKKKITVVDSLFDQALGCTIVGLFFLVSGIASFFLSVFVSGDALHNYIIGLEASSRTNVDLIKSTFGFAAVVALVPVGFKVAVCALGALLIYCGIRIFKKIKTVDPNELVPKYDFVTKKGSVLGWLFHILKGTVIALIIMVIWFGGLIYMIEKF